MVLVQSFDCYFAHKAAAAVTAKLSWTEVSRVNPVKGTGWYNAKMFWEQHQILLKSTRQRRAVEASEVYAWLYVCSSRVCTTACLEEKLNVRFGRPNRCLSSSGRIIITKVRWNPWQCPLRQQAEEEHMITNELKREHVITSELKIRIVFFSAVTLYIYF